MAWSNAKSRFAQQHNQESGNSSTGVGVLSRVIVVLGAVLDTVSKRKMAPQQLFPDCASMISLGIAQTSNAFVQYAVRKWCLMG